MPVSPAGVYDPVTTRPDDTRFDLVASPNVEVKRARTGHVLVRPKVDGLDLGWFIFDTGGGGTILDSKAATKMRLEPVGAETITSFLGTVPTSILRAASLELGLMRVSRPSSAQIGDGLVEIVGGNSKGTGVISAGQIDSRAL